QRPDAARRRARALRRSSQLGQLISLRHRRSQHRGLHRHPMDHRPAHASCLSFLTRMTTKDSSNSRSTTRMPARLLCLPSARRVYNTDVRPSSPTMTIDTSHEQTSYSPKPGFLCHFSPSQCVLGERRQKRTQYPPPFIEQASAPVIQTTITSTGSSPWKKPTCASALSIPICRSLAASMS